jgi:hypothetical protein
MSFLPVIGAAIGGISSIFGGARQASAQNRAAARQYQYDVKNWEFNWDETNRDFQWALQNNQIQRQNLEQELGYREQTALQDWRYDLKIADIQDRTNIAAYNKSLQTYGLQAGFNNVAAANAYSAEIRKLQEQTSEMAFQNQDVVIQALQEAGKAQASGRAGRSAGKALHSVLAAAGRNQAILAESLVSARAAHRQANEKIATDKYGADLQAWANTMIKPIATARPDAPLRMPRAVILDPRKPVKPPKPVQGAKADVRGSTIAGIGNTAANIFQAWPK